MLKQLFNTLSLKVAAVATGAAIATGAAAAAAASGYLPEQARQALSDAADRIDVSLPAPDDINGGDTVAVEELEVGGPPEHLVAGERDSDGSETSKAVLSVIESYHGDDPRQFGKSQASSDDPSAFGRAVSDAARGSHDNQAQKAGEPAPQSGGADAYRPQNPPDDAPRNAGDAYRNSYAPSNPPQDAPRKGSDQAESHPADAPPAEVPARS